MKQELMEVFPEFQKILHRSEKEKFLNQKAKVIWLTGLSGSGKTTLGSLLEEKLFEKGYLAQMLDGDNIRSGINSNLKFSVEDRNENIRRISEVSKLFLNCGVIVINCFISPTESIRQTAKEIIGQENFIEIFINAPISVCEQRDVKGLYKKARRGEIKNFTGIGSPYDNPVDPDLEIRTDILSIQESIKKILDFVIPQVEYK